MLINNKLIFEKHIHQIRLNINSKLFGIKRLFFFYRLAQDSRSFCHHSSITAIQFQSTGQVKQLRNYTRCTTIASRYNQEFFSVAKRILILSYKTYVYNKFG